MNRRSFLCGRTLGTLSAPLAAEAQQTGEVWRIGFIGVEHSRWEDGFFERFRELGYVERQNIIVERRYSEGRPPR